MPGTISGPIRLVGSVHLIGSGTFAAELEGDLSAVGPLTIQSDASIEGAVQAASLDLAGSVHGPVEAQGPVHLRPNARLIGPLTATSAEIEDGAFFQGDLVLGPQS